LLSLLSNLLASLPASLLLSRSASIFLLEKETIIKNMPYLFQKAINNSKESEESEENEEEVLLLKRTKNQDLARVKLKRETL